MSEGRRHFLEHYEGIESGEECQRWLPVLSAMVDGEATPEQMLELRPHLRNCPGCRATLRALQDSSDAARGAAAGAAGRSATPGFGDQRRRSSRCACTRASRASLHERAVNSFTKAQAVVEASAAGKVAAVAASAAAVAGGGYVSVERIGGGSRAGRGRRRAGEVHAGGDRAGSVVDHGSPGEAAEPPRDRASAEAGDIRESAASSRRSAPGREPSIAPEFRSHVCTPGSATAYVARSSTSLDSHRPAPRQPAPPRSSRRRRRPGVRRRRRRSGFERGEDQQPGDAGDEAVEVDVGLVDDVPLRALASPFSRLGPRSSPATEISRGRG